MKLSDIKGEEAFDAIADIIDPIAEIMADAEVKDKYRNAPRREFIKTILKKHKKEMIEVMAVLDRTPVEKYEINAAVLPVKLMEIINDPVIMAVFQSQGQTETSSGSATENTEDAEK